jgi:hypothetical protein
MYPAVVQPEEKRLDKDVYLLYQDYLRLGKVYAEEGIENGKLVCVVQHGLLATRDYLEEDRDLIADKIFLWGKKDYRRMRNLGYPKSKLVVSGCPFLEDIGLKQRPIGRSVPLVFFSPRYFPLLGKENAQVLEIMLRKTDCHFLIRTLESDKNIYFYEGLRDHFPGRVTVEKTNPVWRNHIPNLIERMRVCDLVVSMDESTGELLAMSMDIPVICISDVYLEHELEWHWDRKGGRDVRKRGLYFSEGVYKSRADDIGEMINKVLGNDIKSENRKKVAVEHGGLGLKTKDIIIKEINTTL